ncbi:MAG: ABC transporter ATP-binding protein [Planctomycetota bacterium]
MIEAIGLTKRYGPVLAVNDLDFEVPAGRVTGLLGPNGAGKSTTIRMIVGSLTPTRGRLNVNGFDVQNQSLRARRCIGYLPENTPLYDEMRVIEYLRYRGRLFGMRRKYRTLAIEQVLRRCWLEDVRRRPISQLSKGYRQRVGLAAALLHKPPVLILDEPTTGLDPSQIRETRSLIRELAGEHTVLLSSHILPEVERTCDAIIMIARGEIRAEGTLDELRQRSARHTRYEIETDGENARQAIIKVAGVASVDEDRLNDRWRRLLVTADINARDLREPMARALASIGSLARSLRRLDASLEQLFVEVVGDTDTVVKHAEDGSTKESKTPKRQEVNA